MLKIKRIYTYVLQSFLPVLCMTFCICLFILLMQFLWTHIENFVGKGLGIGVMGELFFYAALTMFPMALPLAVLLASLMTFGNLGESLELLAMKASGISLMKIMRPLMFFMFALAIGAFYFQDSILPQVNTKMYSILIGVRNKSPELEIPEGVFYKEINDYNIYVGHKDFKTGLLHDVIIYIFDGSNIEDATVTVADSARIQMGADKRSLKLTLWSGEQLGSYKEKRKNIKHPKYRRESFTCKEVLIPYKNDLELADESMISSREVGKNLSELIASVDSLDQRIDSVNGVYTRQLRDRTYFTKVKVDARNDSAFFAWATALPGTLASDNKKSKTASKAMTDNSSQEEIAVTKDDNTQTAEAPKVELTTPKKTTTARGNAVGRNETLQTSVDMSKPYHALNLDSVYASLRLEQRRQIVKNAEVKTQNVMQSFDIRKQMQMQEYKTRSRHEIEMHKKFTLSIACLIFFFIGAPLGAIIRKGGLSVPIIVSVIFFIIYFIIDTQGNKAAKGGDVDPWFGVWLSSIVLAPIGVFLTWRAVNDSTLFDWDSYVIYFRRFLKRSKVYYNNTPLAKYTNPITDYLALKVMTCVRFIVKISSPIVKNTRKIKIWKKQSN